jgi:hypothetical protein
MRINCQVQQKEINLHLPEYFNAELNVLPGKSAHVWVILHQTYPDFAGCADSPAKSIISTFIIMIKILILSIVADD